MGCGERAHSQLLIRFCCILSLAQVVLSLANVISVSILDFTLALPLPTPSLHAAGPGGPLGLPGLPGDVGPPGRPRPPGSAAPPLSTSTDIPATANLKSTSATVVSSSPKALPSTRSQSSLTSTTTPTTIRQLSSSETFLFPTVSYTSADAGFPSISAVSPLGSSKPSIRVNKAAIAAGVVLSVVMLAVAVVCFLLYRRRQRARARVHDARASVTTQSSLFSHSVLVSVPSSYGYSYAEKGDGADADPLTEGNSPLPPFAVSDYDDVVRPSAAFAFGTGIQTETQTRDGAGAAGLSGSPLKPLDRAMVAPWELDAIHFAC